MSNVPKMSFKLFSKQAVFVCLNFETQIGINMVIRPMLRLNIRINAKYTDAKAKYKNQG